MHEKSEATLIVMKNLPLGMILQNSQMLFLDSFKHSVCFWCFQYICYWIVWWCTSSTNNYLWTTIKVLRNIINHGVHYAQCAPCIFSFVNLVCFICFQYKYDILRKPKRSARAFGFGKFIIIISVMVPLLAASMVVPILPHDVGDWRLYSSPIQHYELVLMSFIILCLITI